MALLNNADYLSCPPAKSPRCHLERRKCYPQVQAGGKSGGLSMSPCDVGFAHLKLLIGALQGLWPALTARWLSCCHLEATRRVSLGAVYRAEYLLALNLLQALLTGWGWDE